MKCVVIFFLATEREKAAKLQFRALHKVFQLRILCIVMEFKPYLDVETNGMKRHPSLAFLVPME